MLFIPVQAQEEQEIRHEISISYGAVPNSIWIDVLTDIIPAVFGETYENGNYVGPIGLEYYYHTSPLIGVGAIGVFATHNEDGYYKEKLTKHRDKSYITLMPSVKFNWLRKEMWGMYSKIGVGGTYINYCNRNYDENGRQTGEKETTKDFVFNFQASLVGVEVGNDHVRGFAELGIGEQGIALGGVRFRF
jgi:hypothetical protein